MEYPEPILSDLRANKITLETQLQTLARRSDRCQLSTSSVRYRGPYIQFQEFKIDSSEKRLNVEPNSHTVATFSEEGSTHSFIVRIWLEETLEEDGKARWRGHVTHVPGGERRYFEDLSDIVIFILPYLDSMNVHPGALWKIWKRLFGP